MINPKIKNLAAWHSKSPHEKKSKRIYRNVIYRVGGRSQ